MAYRRVYRQIRAALAVRRAPAPVDRIVNDDIGLSEPGQRIERQQAGIARSGAGEPDMARGEDGNSGPPGRQ